MWINLLSRTDLTTVGKLAWAIFGLIPLVPFLYVLTGGDLFRALRRPTHASAGHCARDSNFPRAMMYAAQKISADTANSATPHR
jgi:hypothetical protein